MYTARHSHGFVVEHVVDERVGLRRTAPASIAARVFARSTSTVCCGACSRTRSRSSGAPSETPASHVADGSVWSTRSTGRSVQLSSAPAAVGAPNNSDGLECAAAGWPESTATTSRNTPMSCVAELVGSLEAVVGARRRGLLQRAIQRVVALEQRCVLDGRKRRDVSVLVPAELHREHGERAPDREDVAGDTRPDVGDLGCLEADGAVDRAHVVVDAPHAAEVDQLQAVAGLDHVVGLEVAVQQTLRVQVRERGEDLDDVRDGLVGRERVVAALVRVMRSFKICFSDSPPTYSMTM